MLTSATQVRPRVRLCFSSRSLATTQVKPSYDVLVPNHCTVVYYLMVFPDVHFSAWPRLVTSLQKSRKSLAAISIHARSTPGQIRELVLHSLWRYAEIMRLGFVQ